MTYEQFYDLADYLNELTGWSFTNREVACFAYDYLLEYNASVLYPTRTMIELCKDLVLAMDEVTELNVYINCDWEMLSNDDMYAILTRAWEEI